jgi:hypothetical protein
MVTIWELRLSTSPTPSVARTASSAKAVVGDGAAGIAINGSDVLVVNNGSNSVSVLGKEGTVVSTLKDGISPYGVPGVR